VVTDPAPTIDGTYSFAGSVAGGSDPNCEAKSGQFDVTVAGRDPNRQLRIANLAGVVHADNSFEVSGGLTSGTGSDTFTGSFDAGANPVTISGEDTIVAQTGNDGGTLTCVFDVTATKL
jgi:hypothetical protein